MDPTPLCTRCGCRHFSDYKCQEPNYHVRPKDPASDPRGDLAYFILRELLALPPGVLDRPIFRKVKGHLENYRKHYT